MGVWPVWVDFRPGVGLGALGGVSWVCLPSHTGLGPKPPKSFFPDLQSRGSDMRVCCSFITNQIAIVLWIAPPTRSYVEELLRDIDEDHDGRLDLHEFKAFCSFLSRGLLIRALVKLCVALRRFAVTFLSVARAGATAVEALKKRAPRPHQHARARCWGAQAQALLPARPVGPPRAWCSRCS